MTGLLLLLVMAQASPSALNESLWEAARAGDAARVASLIAEGADVNAKARYDMTALHFAADKGHRQTADSISPAKTERSTLSLRIPISP